MTQVLIPQEQADSQIDNLGIAYHAAIEAMMLRDKELMAEGLGMLEVAAQEAIREIHGFMAY